MVLRRGFFIPEGARVLVAEDVITTGKSVLETIEVIEQHGWRVVGVTSIVNRSERCQFEVSFKALVSISPPVYDLEDCPLCRDNVEIDVPGSRFLK